ncbi:hypothetical protein EON78_04925, partial [bacterium]
MEKHNTLPNILDKKRDYLDKDFCNNESLTFFTEVFDKNFLGLLGIKKVIIFTDTNREALQIRNKFLLDKVEEVQIICRDKCSEVTLDYSINSNEILKLYFFSGAYNMLFLKDLFNYIPFQFKPEEVDDSFETYNFIVYKDGVVDSNKIEQIAQNIKKFHQLIFSEAEFHPENLSSLYYAYNEQSKTKEPFKILDDVHAYSKCLIFHNMDNPVFHRVEDIWQNLWSYGEESNYARELSQVIIRSHQAYILLSIQHLHNNFKLSGIHQSSPKYPIIMDLLKDRLLHEGRYSLLYRDFVKSELTRLIRNQGLKSNENPVKKAIRANIKEDAILHNLLYRILRRSNDSKNITVTPSDLLNTSNGDFEFLLELQKTKEGLNNNIDYINLTSLIHSLDKIELFFKKIVKSFSQYTTE